MESIRFFCGSPGCGRKTSVPRSFGSEDLCFCFLRNLYTLDQLNRMERHIQLEDIEDGKKKIRLRKEILNSLGQICSTKKLPSLFLSEKDKSIPPKHNRSSQKLSLHPCQQKHIKFLNVLPSNLKIFP